MATGLLTISSDRQKQLADHFSREMIGCVELPIMRDREIIDLQHQNLKQRKRAHHQRNELRKTTVVDDRIDANYR